MTQDPVAQKRVLRAEFRKRFQDITEDQKALRDEAIRSLFLALPQLKEADGVLLYASCGHEIETASIAEALLTRGIPVAYPRCETVGHTMTFHSVANLRELTPGAYGIPEPAPHLPHFFPTEKTVCLVPGLAFDTEGYRLGRGGGYYDRYLAGEGACAFCVGAIPAACLSESPLPRGAFDRSVQILITEKGVITPHGGTTEPTFS